MKTSIVVLAYHQLADISRCIESIRTHTAADQYELIVADFCCDHQAAEWLRRQEDVRVIDCRDQTGLAGCYNQGIKAAGSADVLLMRCDIVVTEGWLSNLRACLFSSSDVGAVAPMSNNCANAQAVAVSYQTMDAMQVYARSHNQRECQWEERMKLLNFCLLLKRSAIDAAGLLDERFSPCGYEDDDYSFSLRMAGYRLLVSKHTFVHSDGKTPFSVRAENISKFIDKWGFNPTYSAIVRHDIINLMDGARDASVVVLDIGCACGATLMHIKNVFPNAVLHGIEFNEYAAASAKLFANVMAADIEQAQLPYPQAHFDYIILADVLEHLRDPWQALKNLLVYLKPSGHILVSLPNVTHFTVMRSLLNGNWRYEDAGILDRTHLRFFTVDEITKMFANAGYQIVQQMPLHIYESAQDKAFIERLTQIAQNPRLGDQLRTYQYLVKAVNVSNRVAAEQQAFDLQELIFLLRRIEQMIEINHNLAELSNQLSTGRIAPAQVVQAIATGMIRRKEVLRIVVISCVQRSLWQVAKDIVDEAYRVMPDQVGSELDLWRNFLQNR